MVKGIFIFKINEEDIKAHINATATPASSQASERL